MATVGTLNAPSAAGRPGGGRAIPWLESGDQLTREEFERRYQAMPAGTRAELIEGTVYMSSPVRWDFHAGRHADLIAWLSIYRINTPGVQLGDNGTLRLDAHNEPQPDATLIVMPAFGGRAKVSDDGYLEGTPELVAEVSGSSVSIDLHRKLEAYRRNGIPEYLVWRVEDRAVDWFALKGGAYEPIPADGEGIVRSTIFPGLWLAPRALIDADLMRVAAVARLGLTSPEHEQFELRLEEQWKVIAAAGSSQT
jgi:Uma2 family endonuclease